MAITEALDQVLRFYQVGQQSRLGELAMQRQQQEIEKGKLEIAAYPERLRQEQMASQAKAERERVDMESAKLGLFEKNRLENLNKYTRIGNALAHAKANPNSWGFVGNALRQEGVEAPEQYDENWLGQAEQGVNVFQSYLQDQPKVTADQMDTAAEKGWDTPGKIQQAIIRGEMNQAVADRNAAKAQKEKEAKIPEVEAGLRDKFQALPVYKELDVIETAKDKIEQAGPDPTGDLSIIYGFMKLQDPTSSVKESEQATAANAGGVDSMVRATWNKVFGGGSLDPAMRAMFVRESKNLYSQRKSKFDKVANEYRRLAVDQGANPDNVVLPIYSDNKKQSQSGPKLSPDQEGQLLDLVNKGVGIDEALKQMGLIK